MKNGLVYWVQKEPNNIWCTDNTVKSGRISHALGTAGRILARLVCCKNFLSPFLS
jgi:hypothetical protein